MSRRAALFTEADLRRAMKVAREFDMAAEVQPDGAIRIVPIAKPLPKTPEERRIVL